MAKKRKKPRHEEHMDESWLLPYSDLLTLLLALFIVLFASSSIDAQKLERFSQVFSAIFQGGAGVMDNMTPLEVPTPASQTNMTLQDRAYLSEQAALEDIQEEVDQYIAVKELEEKYETTMTDEGLLITIRDSVLFGIGRAEVKPEYVGIARDLGKMLRSETPRNIVITGHTDNIPIANSRYDSNWELSVMRAVNFLKIVVQGAKLNPLYFSAKGYGEYRPIASNKLAEGRAQNRRVEVLIQPSVNKDGSKRGPLN